MSENTVQHFQQEMGKITIEERLLTNTESLLRAVMQTSADAIILSDSGGNVLSWNEGARRIFGYEEREILGRPLTILIPDQFKEAHRRGLDRVATGGGTRIIGRVAEVEGITKDGVILPIELSLSSWVVEDQMFFGGIIRDISERKRLERVMEDENRRRTQELDDARELQLSMLPSELPQRPNFEVAASMHTATEVGGDYYDFDVVDDGTLTLVLGDATGHGMKAGAMVTATKGLWHAYSREPVLVDVLQKTGEALRQMRMPMLYMALAVARLKGNTLELAGAGMPQALIYRSKSETIERIDLKGMPLGGPMKYPYQSNTLELIAGDTLMMMSDGFPELFDAEGTMFGYDRAVETFTEVASRSPAEIVSHFNQVKRDWAGDGSPDDDVTFLVLKLRDTEARR
jgi:PAS domain S-box-containing protein